MNKLFNPKHTKLAKTLRRNATEGERILWNKLRNKEMLGYRFRRQYQASSYIIDFVCLKKMLAIEIDGSSHDEAKYDYDLKRQRELESLGFKFLRFTEHDVKTRLSEVLQTIEKTLMDVNSTSL